MRLREIGPGIGGLYYDPLLRQRNERAMRRTLARLPQDCSATTPAELWQSICAVARTMGARIVAAREAEAARRIEAERARLSGAEDAEGAALRRAAFGSRYY